jgi:hypothetical protein
MGHAQQGLGIVWTALKAGLIMLQGFLNCEAIIKTPARPRWASA